LQDSQALGLKIDKIYNSMQLPNKMKMGVSGCLLSCSESGVKDIGVVGTNRGWRIFVGGNAGPRPRLGELLVDDVANDEAVLEILARVIAFYKSSPQQGRLGKLVEEMGIEAFRAEILGVQAQAASGE
jgi:NAD(P)H-nitrite reductase large subunit